MKWKLKWKLTTLRNGRRMRLMGSPLRILRQLGRFEKKSKLRHITGWEVSIMLKEEYSTEMIAISN